MTAGTTVIVTTTTRIVIMVPITRMVDITARTGTEMGTITIHNIITLAILISAYRTISIQAGTTAATTIETLARPASIMATCLQDQGT